MSPLSFLFLTNAVLAILLVRRVARQSEANRHVLPRLTVLSVLLFLEVCVMLVLDCHIRIVFFLVVVVCLASIVLPEDLTRGISRLPGRGRFSVYILSVATVAALVFVHLPIMSYLTSPEEMGLSLEHLLSANVRDAMVMVYLAAGVFAFAVSPRMRSVLSLLALTSLFLALLYSYVLPLGYPVMNGLMFEMIALPVTEMAGRAMIDEVAVAIASLSAFYAFSRFGTKKILTGIVLINSSLAAVSAGSLARATPVDVAPSTGAAALGEPPIRFSKEHRNVLIIMLDRFMGGFVEDILIKEPQLLAGLEGFTWYPRTISAGDNSLSGLHPLLGGYDYTPREMNARDLPLRDLSAESFAILPFNFRRMGYEANVVNPHGLGFRIEGDCGFLGVDGANCTSIPLSLTTRMAERYEFPMATLTESDYADLLVLLGLMRSAPYVLKAVLDARSSLWELFRYFSAGNTFRQWAELKSLPDLTTVGSEKSNYNQIFNSLPHEPYFLSNDCRPLATEFRVPAEEFRKQGFETLFAYQHAIGARCSLLIVSDYFEWMKRAGVYDNTKIVIVSDHGIVGPVEDRSSRAEAGGTTEERYVRSRSVLFVKEREAHGRLNISEEFLPNAEVPRIVCEELGGCVNPFLNNRTIEAHGRDDPFLIATVPWQFNLQKPNSFVIWDELELVGGDPYAAEGWREVKKD